ncbi:hypothetical protein KBB96_02040 [Luteolibacter ambystomatis]|uniref:LamG-like jellyroll fold domain-containing protein n=1 Tax=Luteolibacter ambystomatis TaxID=2824561 RepID=A0A975J0C4_9BACT|nr:LamG-like jellyroll fold domain-containing protein [Luteolibacter ambystomatis]QUE51682.1 hypothetical protein KBB96_02040 [Luteolibacter ambystomatis]
MTPDPRLSHLLARLSDGLIEPAEAEELDEILRNDAAAREYYLVHIAVHFALGDENAGERIRALPPFRRSRSWTWLAAAAALAISAVTWMWWPSPATPAERQTAGKEGEVIPSVLAIVTAQDGVQWNLPEPAANGIGLPVGEIKTTTGDLSISILDGPAVTFRGPAEFRLVSRSQIHLIRGKAAFRGEGPHRMFIVEVEHGSVANTGGEFSVIAEEGGDARLRCFAGGVRVSTAGVPDEPLDEWDLQAGNGLLISTTIQRADDAEGDFPRVPPSILPGPSIRSEAYPRAIMESSPMAYWRFEKLGLDGMVTDETSGGHSLALRGMARLEGASQRYLFVNNTDASGFADSISGIKGLDTPRGRSIECLLYSSGESLATAVALELDGPIPDDVRQRNRSNHAPDASLLEITGRSRDFRDSNPGHVFRALRRSPAGYDGGFNLMSSRGNLLHRWVHVAATFGPDRMCLYIDGEPSREIIASSPSGGVSLRAIVGRLQPGPVDAFRQWSGGIDELALYDRPLSAAEVKAHFAASHR